MHRIIEVNRRRRSSYHPGGVHGSRHRGDGGDHGAAHNVDDHIEYDHDNSDNDGGLIRSATIGSVIGGGGILTDAMARIAKETVGIDLGGESLKVAQLHAWEAETPNVSYREISAEALALEQPASFDVVTCMEMLEHVPDPASIVAACAKLVKPSGWVFFSTINRSPKSFLQAIVGAEYLLGLVPRGTHEYAKFIQPADLLSWARDSGLQATSIKGLRYNPLTQRYSVVNDASVNFWVATQKSA